MPTGGPWDGAAVFLSVASGRPVVDAISMNAMVVDVSSVEGIRPGEEAVLFGTPQGAAEITAGGVGVGQPWHPRRPVHRLGEGLADPRLGRWHVRMA